MLKNKYKELLVIIILVINVILVYSATFTTISQGDFNNGTYNNTYYNTTHNFTQINITSFYSGNYTSQIFNAGSTAQWNNISWFTEVPYNKELPNNQEVETGDFLRGMNMTGNVLMMHFNNDSSYGENNTHVYDFSGNGNNGTWNGDTTPDANSGPTSSGKLNGAFMFDGTGDYINLGTKNIFNFTAGKTILVWFKANSDVTNYRAIAVQENTGAYWQLLLEQTTGKLYFDDNSNAAVITSASAYNDNLWHMATAVTDTSINRSRLYVDGVEVKNATYTSITGSGHNPLWVGASNYVGGVYYPFIGTMDEVAIWNRSLSATEVLDIYKRGALRLNLSVQSCDDSACSGESFAGTYNNSPSNLSIANNSFFQYRAFFETDNLSVTPELYNLTIDYTILDVTPPPSSLGDGICDAWEDFFSIDCNVASSPGGGNVGGIENNTINNIQLHQEQNNYKKVLEELKLNPYFKYVIFGVAALIIVSILDNQYKKKRK